MPPRLLDVCDSKKHEPLIPYLLCSGSGFLFPDTATHPGSKLHTGPTADPPREHGGPRSGDKQLGWPRQEGFIR